MSRLRYWRADTSPKERCPTCGETVIALRWGHEERCAAFRRVMRRRVARIGAVLLILTLAVFALPPLP